MYSDFNVWITLVIIAVVMGVVQGACAYLVLLERKIAAWTQDRIGPNRVGPFGLLQPIADGLKFVFKEQIIPGKVDKIFYLVAPVISMTAALMAFAVVPFGRTSAPPTLLDRRPVAEADLAGVIPISRTARPGPRRRPNGRRCWRPTANLPMRRTRRPSRTG